MSLTIGSLFSGIGGLELGLEWAGAVPGDEAMLIILGMMITGAMPLEGFVGGMCGRHRSCLDGAMDAHLRRIDGKVA